MNTLLTRLGPLGAGVLGVALALTLRTTAVAAQSPAPAAPPAPAQPAASPVVAPPTRLAPPRAVAAAPRGRAVAPTLAPAPVRPGLAGGALPPDSVRPAAARAAAVPPAGAVARCGDGSFIVPPAVPGACAARGGLRVMLPQRDVLAPVLSAAAAPVARVVAAPAVPPAGATMRCKDGTWLTGAPAEGRCSANGGTAAILAPARAVPPPPARSRRP